MKNVHNTILEGNALNVFIKDIETKPYLYLKTRTLVELYALLGGYEMACYDHHIQGYGVFPFCALTSYLARKFNVTETISCYEILLQQSENNQEKAYKLFFDIWDEINSLDRESLYCLTFDKKGDMINWCSINADNKKQCTSVSLSRNFEDRPETPK